METINFDRELTMHTFNDIIDKSKIDLNTLKLIAHITLDKIPRVRESLNDIVNNDTNDLDSFIEIHTYYTCNELSITESSDRLLVDSLKMISMFLRNFVESKLFDLPSSFGGTFDSQLPFTSKPKRKFYKKQLAIFANPFGRLICELSQTSNIALNQMNNETRNCVKIDYYTIRSNWLNYIEQNLIELIRHIESQGKTL